MNRNDTEFMVQKIRTQYMEKDSSEKNLDLLRELDKEVKLPANVFGYVFGSISAMIMGAGMSFVMTDMGEHLGISNAMPLGIVIGTIGMLMASIIISERLYANGKISACNFFTRRNNTLCGTVYRNPSAYCVNNREKQTYENYISEGKLCRLRYIFFCESSVIAFAWRKTACCFVATVIEKGTDRSVHFAVVLHH